MAYHTNRNRYTHMHIHMHTEIPFLHFVFLAHLAYMPKILSLYLVHHRLTHGQTLRQVHTHRHTCTKTLTYRYICTQTHPGLYTYTNTHGHICACGKSMEIVTSHPFLSQNWQKLFLETGNLKKNPVT